MPREPIEALWQRLCFEVPQRSSWSHPCYKNQTIEKANFGATDVFENLMKAKTHKYNLTFKFNVFTDL